MDILSVEIRTLQFVEG